MTYTREIDFNGEYLRIVWNGGYQVNFQTPIGGQWVDYDCFTCYDIATEQDALEHAYEVLQDQHQENEQ
jgi:hypothetical protein